jgi:manganese/zinc/iron transport system permease protein
MGDVMSHAALPGLCVAFILAGGKAPLALMLGAAGAAWLASWRALALTDRAGVVRGASLACVLSGFFGVGVILLSWIQKLPGASAGGLDSYLFGQAAGLVAEQVWAMGITGVLACLAGAALVNPYRVLAFDPQFARVAGLPVRLLEVVFLGLLIAAIVVGLSAVGVVLMSAMLVAPAAAARQWCRSFGGMLAVSAAIGGACGGAGGLLSASVEGAPTGPVIVLILAAAAAVSVVFGTQKGLLRRRRA